MGADPSPDVDLSRGRRALELARPWVLLSLYAALAAAKVWWLAVPVAVAVCLAAFVQMHDTIHASLGLGKRANDAVLSLSGLLLLKSGHALRATHLRHHGKCLGETDPEGAPAHWPFWRALFGGPFHMLTLRREALRIAPRTRGVQLAETAATVAVLAGAVLLFVWTRSLAGFVYWAIAAAVTGTMPVWAAYLPHRLAPEHPAVRAGGRIAQVWTPVIASFAFHHEHHRFPRVPTALLPSVARPVEPE
jgi:fatty acid desaturase